MKYLTNSLRALFLSLAVLLPLTMLAQVEVEIDGINYELNSDTKQASVVSKKSGVYSGIVSIPASLEYMGSSYSVVSIGKDAFKQSYNLYSITIPNSVTIIEDGAFYACPYLDSANIPNSVTSIGDYAFYNCVSLRSIALPNSVVSIGSNAFAGCSSLSSVTIPNSLTSIEYETFCNCTELRTVIIGDGVTSIGYGAFSSCHNLASVTIGKGVRNIDFYAFSDCNNLRDVFCLTENVPSKYPYSFDVYIASTTLHVPEASVDSYTSSWNQFGTIVAISSSDEQVEIGGIKYELAVNTRQATVIGKSSDIYSGEIIIPESVEYKGSNYRVTTIADSAFYGHFDLTSVIIPNTVTYIGDDAFNSSGLTSVTIPNSITNIGRGTFYNCDDLTSINIPNSVTSIGYEAFRACKGLTSVTIPNSVTHIGYRAFCDCSVLTSIFIPQSVTSIGYDVLGNCTALTEISVDEGNTKYDSRENSNALIETSSNTLISGCQTTIIPNSVTNIAFCAFENCHGLTSVTIPNSVTSIGYGAFIFCRGVTSVTIGSGVTSIGSYAFSGCSGLTSVTIPNSVTSIGDWAFWVCDGLTSVTIPNSVTRIGDYAFNACLGLTSVTIGSGVEEIGYRSFANCPKLFDVYCHTEKAPSTDSEAFYDLEMKNVTLHVPAGSIESYKTTEPWNSFGNIVALPKEYQLTVSSVGYATLYLDYNAEIPEGVEAYVATEVIDGSLKMKQVEGVLPANTGVIIVADQGTYTFIDTDQTPATIEKNLLQGSVANTYVTAEANTTYYVLSAPDGDVAMYRAKLTDGKFLNNAHKAYLPISNGDLGIFDDEVDSSVEQLSRRLVFDFGDETSIDEVKTENGKVKTAVYDLSGRRIQKAQKGIYIQNGKLMVK